MDIKKILQKVKDGEIDVEEALSKINDLNAVETSSKIKIKRISKDEVKDLIREKRKSEEKEDRGFQHEGSWLTLNLEFGAYEIEDGDTFRVEGICEEDYDEEKHVLKLKKGKECSVYVPYNVKNIKIISRASSVDIDLSSKEYVELDVSKSSVEGKIDVEEFKISNSLGNTELEITACKRGMLENKLGNVEIGLTGKYHFDVSNTLGYVDIDEDLISEEGGIIKVKNQLGNIEFH